MPPRQPVLVLVELPAMELSHAPQPPAANGSFVAEGEGPVPA